MREEFVRLIDAERVEADGGPSVFRPSAGQADQCWVFVEYRALFLEWQLDRHCSVIFKVRDDLAVEAVVGSATMRTCAKTVRCAEVVEPLLGRWIGVSGVQGDRLRPIAATGRG
jgi:hypothetical protein